MKSVIVVLILSICIWAGEYYGIDTTKTIPKVFKEIDSGDMPIFQAKDKDGLFDSILLIGYKNKPVKIVLVKYFSNDATGSQAKSFFNEMQEALEKKYGKFKLTQYNMGGSFFDKPNNFSYGLRKNKIVHSAYNENPNQELRYLSIRIAGERSDGTSVTIGYETKAYYKAKNQIDSAKKSKL